MRHIQFAIAAIVDSNTGFGFRPQYDSREVDTLKKHAHRIRARSVLALFRAAREAVSAFIANRREKARQRRALSELAQLNDHYLEDIGLTRGDIAAVELGQVSLESLNAERRVRLSTETRALGEAAGGVNVAADASNQDSFVAARCA